MAILSKISLDRNEVENQLVVFLSKAASPCTLCSAKAEVDHKHYLLESNRLCEPQKTPESVALRCLSCNNPVVSLLCSGCLNAYYCSMTCRESHWLDHQRVCHIVLDGQKVTSSGDANVGTDTPDGEKSPFSFSHHSSIEEINSPLPNSTLHILREQRHTTQPLSEAIIEKLSQNGILKQNGFTNGPTDGPTDGPTNDPTNGPTNDPTNCPAKSSDKSVLSSSPDRGSSTSANGLNTSSGEAVAELLPLPRPKDMYDGILEHELTIQLEVPIVFGVYWRSELEASIFFISPQDQDAVIGKVTSRIKGIRKAAEVQGIKPLEQLVYGSYCLAFSPDDQELYRARIMDITDKDVKVFFSDYGNFSRVLPEMILPLPEDLAPTVIPFQSVPARGLDAKTTSKMKECYKHCNNVTMKAIKKEGRTYIVTLV